MRLRAVGTVPTLPIVGVGAGAKWAADRIGPVVWVILGLLILGGVVLYRHQPRERQEEIKRVAGDVGMFLLEEASAASSSVRSARQILNACLVPAPGRPTRMSAVLRELAMAADSLSAQQLHEALAPASRPAVGILRELLHANKTTIFGERRSGSFVLGKSYVVRQRAA